MNVTLKGRLATFINGARTSDVDKEYVAEFEFKGNRVQIRNFREIRGQWRICDQGLCSRC